MEDIDKLKEIFLTKDIDDDDYQENLDQITKWESGLIRNENIVGWQEHDITKEIFNTTKESYMELSLRLSNDRKLTEKERMSIFAKQDAMLWILNLASKSPQKELDSIKTDIRKALKI